MTLAAAAAKAHPGAQTTETRWLANRLAALVSATVAPSTALTAAQLDRSVTDTSSLGKDPESKRQRSEAAAQARAHAARRSCRRDIAQSTVIAPSLRCLQQTAVVFSYPPTRWAIPAILKDVLGLPPQVALADLHLQPLPLEPPLSLALFTAYVATHGLAQLPKNWQDSWANQGRNRVKHRCALQSSAAFQVNPPPISNPSLSLPPAIFAYV